MANKPNAEDEPGEVSVEQGIVLLDGPAGVVVAMTPAAAAETGERLRDAGRKAEEDQAG